jgi:hypothetical protein
LALRDSAGQAARVLTGYDILLLSVLTEAQAGRLPTTAAGPCPLRGFRPAMVVDATTPAVQATTAVALLAGGAALADKVIDGDVPVWLRPVASRSARHLARVGASSARLCGFDGHELSDAPGRAQLIEARPGASLDQLLEPTGTTVSALFAHTAMVAGVPDNAIPLGRAGEAFGRLVHLIDAQEDRESDRRRGCFNPLDATGTTTDDAARLARQLHAELRAAVAEVKLVDGALAEALLGPTLRSAINRVWGAERAADAAPRSERRGVGLVGVAAALLAQAAICGGGRRRRRRERYVDEAAYGPMGGPGGGGCGCGQEIGCDCCADIACSECCSGCCDGLDCCSSLDC